MAWWRGIGGAVGLVVAAAVLWVDAPAAGACSCQALTDDGAFGRATAVFVGDLTERDGPRPEGGWSSTLDPVRYTFDVSDVYKGDVRSGQVIVSAVSSASCGMDMGDSGTWLVFAREPWGPDIDPGVEEGDLVTDLCSGTRPINVAAVPASFGPAEPPGDPSSAPPEPAASVPVSSDDSSSGDGASTGFARSGEGFEFWLLALQVMAGGFVVLLLAIVVAWRRRWR